MLRRLRVEGYRLLADLEVEPGPLSVVFGPNGAGKGRLDPYSGERLVSLEKDQELIRRTTVTAQAVFAAPPYLQTSRTSRSTRGPSPCSRAP
ncbi:hypothetical protein [Chondromyces apiculatus]|uniref:Rad50/SbcC-type AAA domain-containing protein n=1 Tax=Chondromyces apiculatus DSM 436 TaxID=1192034 RepID=A0A017TB23_9BACT|nr:hypothetical protein [Chondromyces apiculatus]EYF06483.1 Hypothetical protein CAP_2013 [Chondromyces apiculatus DSM 436]